MRRIIMLACFVAIVSGCSQKEEKQQTENIDSTVVGKDTTSVDIRRDIDLSDEQKRVLPDEATEPTKSDESEKKND